jgi:hypothetical protein
VREREDARPALFITVVITITMVLRVVSPLGSPESWVTLPDNDISKWVPKLERLLGITEECANEIARECWQYEEGWPQLDCDTALQDIIISQKWMRMIALLDGLYGRDEWYDRPERTVTLRDAIHMLVWELIPDNDHGLANDKGRWFD